MAGVDRRDPTSVAAPAPADYVAAARLGAAEPDLRGLRIGVPTEHYFEELHPEVEAAVRAAIGQLGQLGAAVVDVALPDHAALMAGCSGLGAEALVYHQRWLRERADDYGDDVRARLLAAQFVSAADYAIGLRARRL